MGGQESDIAEIHFVSFDETILIHEY